MVSTTDNYFFNPQPCICECCRPRYSTFTISTGVVHKWTKQEIKDEIQTLAVEIAQAKWLQRGQIRERLQHWIKKLERFEEAEQEFKIK